MSSLDLRLDRDNQCLWRRGERVLLTPKAFAVLHHLQQHSGQLVMKSELLEAVWPDTFVGDAVLTVTIKQLRDLLGDDARQPHIIETVHRRGYRLIADIPLASATNLAPTPEVSGASLTEVADGDDLFGRGTALQQLADAWSQAGAGRRQLCFVTGEAGIGKTALVDAFVTRLRRAAGTPTADDTPPLLIGRGQCLEEYGTTEAYLPVLEALEDILRSTPSPSFLAQLRRCAPTWFAQFPWLLSDSDTEHLQRELHGATRERMLRELATTLELAAARTPIVLVLEDLHWCDPSTVSLLTFLAQRRHPARLLIVATFRPVDLIVAAHPLKDAKQRLQVARQCVEVALDQLDVGAVRQVLNRRLAGDASDETIELLLHHSNGNPLFLRNLLDHLTDAQLLHQRNGVWHASREALQGNVPAGLRQVIEHGLERLTGDELAVLEAASVAGFEFTTDAAAAGISRDPTIVASLCEELARRGDLIRAAGTRVIGSERVVGVYDFVHALFQNVLYQRIAPARRTELHRRLALWGEDHGAGVGELAHHFAQAGPGETVLKSIDYARRAAARARAIFAFDEAAAHLESALAAVRSLVPPQPHTEAEVLIELGTAWQRGGRMLTAEPSFIAATEVARTCSDADAFARAAMGIAYGYQRLGDQEERVLALLEETLHRLPPGDHPLRALAMAHLEYGRASASGLALRHPSMADEATAMARRTDDVAVRVDVMLHLRWAFRGPCNRDDWRSDLEEIRSLRSRAREVEPRLVLHCLEVDVWLELGDFSAAREALEAFAIAVDEARLPWFAWLALGFEHKLALLRGDFEAAEKLSHATLAAGQETEHPNVGILFAGQTAIRLITQGRLHELEPVVRAGLEQNPQVSTWRAVLAFLAAELGHLDDARDNFAPMADDIDSLPRDTSWFVMMSFASVACHRLRDRERAAVLYRKLLGHAEGFTGFSGCLISAGHTGRYLGLLAATMGDRKAAIRHFEMALERNQELGALPWVALTAHDYASFLEDGRERAAKTKAASLHQHAAELAQSLGMTPWLELWSHNRRSA